MGDRMGGFSLTGSLQLILPLQEMLILIKSFKVEFALVDLFHTDSIIQIEGWWRNYYIL